MKLKKEKLILNAWEEGHLKNKGNSNKAGSEIEKYLHSIRVYVGKNNPQYLDPSVGFY